MQKPWYQSFRGTLRLVEDNPQISGNREVFRKLREAVSAFIARLCFLGPTANPFLAFNSSPNSLEGRFQASIE